MHALVTRLEPRRGSFEDGLTAFRAARLRLCISELHAIDSVPAALVRARALLRLGNFKGVLTAASIASDTTRDHGELALLRAVAFSRLGDDRDAREAFTEARIYAISSGNVALEAELEFYLGFDAFRKGDLEETRKQCFRALDIAKTPPVGEQTQGIVPLSHVVSRAQELLGLADAADGQYREWLGYARESLATLCDSTIPDVYQEAWAVRNLAILARDFDLDNEATTIAARADGLAWTQEIAHHKFVTLEALGWCSAVRGDVVGALRRFRTAEKAASTPPEEILVGVNRALIAREVGHHALVVEEIEEALSTADSYNWETAPDDYRLYLLPLAQAAAPLAPARARELVVRYRAIRNAMDCTFAARFEARVRAEESYTDGVVLRAEGRIDASSACLSNAFSTWERIGYEWRAARAALELAELGAGDAFQLAIRRELRRRPDSLFAARARAVAA